MTPAHLKGQLLQSRCEYLRERHGPGAVARVLKALPAEDRERLRGLTRDGWYPFRTLVRLDRAIADAGGDEGIFVEDPCQCRQEPACRFDVRWEER